ncbi:hypothetical protein [Streptomyces dysideae]|uniref:Uncharacterized protein n=1 Tax=Streptomyces dysideae TaxID=909626 RepID=A0A117S1L7_9ACTN|nr:hypothetical protein [Streptomyces dysideae]KUO21064.1 hypothetical protein AQJ91_10500 [Streptomyces dysideae]
MTDASAASGNGACSVTGAKGGMTFTNWMGSYVDFRSMDDAWVTDWSWHLNYNGSGSTIYFDTYASHSPNRLDYIGAQVAVREGSTIVRSCTFWA